MRSEEAKAIGDFLLATFDSEVNTTASVLSAVPGGRLDYRPDPLSKTAIGLARHITLEDEWFLNTIADGRFSPPPDDSDACGIMTPEQAATRYKAGIPAALARVRALSGAQLAEVMEMFGMQLPRIVALGLALRHSTHHRGQLTAYLRAMGGKVPGIYGPSADTQQAAAV